MRYQNTIKLHTMLQALLTAASPRLNSVLEGRAYLHRVMVALPRHWRTHLRDQDIEEGAGLAAPRTIPLGRGHALHPYIYIYPLYHFANTC